MAEHDETRFNEIKDRLIALTGSPGLTSYHGGTVHMTLGEWERLVDHIGPTPTTSEPDRITPIEDDSERTVQAILSRPRQNGKATESRERFYEWVNQWQSVETRVEYRAIYRRPASILDKDDVVRTTEDGTRYVEEATGYDTDKETVRQVNYDLRRSEETWASIHHWETRTVLVGPWKEEA